MRRVTTLTVALACAVSAHAAPHAADGHLRVHRQDARRPAAVGAPGHAVRRHPGRRGARDLYQKLKATPRRDACLDDGSMTKRAGDVQCTATVKPKGHVCTFAIDLVQHKLAAGAVC
jgi:hypothetical protein